MKQFVAGINEENLRLSRFVEKVCPRLPKSLLHKSFRNGRIKINNKKETPEYRIRTGDVLELYINDEFFTLHHTPSTIPPLSSKDICYEDDQIIIVYKKAGILVHSDITKDASLVDMVIRYLQIEGTYTPQAEAVFRPAPCNRLDRGTEGLVIIAKTYAALQEMNQFIKSGAVRKYYFCVTLGNPADNVYTAYLKRDTLEKKVTVQSAEFKGSKQIITKVTLLKKNRQYSLLEIELLTGRTHQIRSHLAFLGHPILGDRKYGNRNINQKLHIENQLLSAYKIIFSEAFHTANILKHLANKEVTLPHPSIIKTFENLPSL